MTEEQEKKLKETTYVLYLDENYRLINDCVRCDTKWEKGMSYKSNNFKCDYYTGPEGDYLGAQSIGYILTGFYRLTDKVKYIALLSDCITQDYFSECKSDEGLIITAFTITDIIEVDVVSFITLVKCCHNQHDCDLTDFRENPSVYKYLLTRRGQSEIERELEEFILKLDNHALMLSYVKAIIDRVNSYSEYDYNSDTERIDLDFNRIKSHYVKNKELFDVLSKLDKPVNISDIINLPYVTGDMIDESLAVDPYLENGDVDNLLKILRLGSKESISVIKTAPKMKNIHVQTMLEIIASRDKDVAEYVRRLFIDVKENIHQREVYDLEKLKSKLVKQTELVSSLEQDISLLKRINNDSYNNKSKLQRTNLFN